jgi:periplasmic protein TonB
MMASTAISLMLHVLVLAGFNSLTYSPSTSRLGMPWISVWLGTQNDLGSSPSKQVHAKPVRTPADNNRMASANIPQEFPETAAGTFPVAENKTAILDKPSTPGDESRELARNHLQGLLQTRLSDYLVYPPLARSRGWEGTVLMGLRVEPDGHLDKIHVARSSGYAVLDNSALHSLHRLGNLVEASAWLEDRGIDVQLPVIYQLIDK